MTIEQENNELEANQTIRDYEKMQKVTRYKAPWEK